MPGGRLTHTGAAPHAAMNIGPCTTICTEFEESQSRSPSIGSRAIGALQMLLHSTSMLSCRKTAHSSRPVGGWPISTHVAGAWESFVLANTMVGVPSSNRTKRCISG